MPQKDYRVPESQLNEVAAMRESLRQLLRDVPDEHLITVMRAYWMATGNDAMLNAEPRPDRELFLLDFALLILNAEETRARRRSRLGLQ